jgi:hypothetical protein
MPAWLGLAIMLALLLVTRHIGVRRWRTRAWSETQVALLLAVPWLLFPFLGIVAGAPWHVRAAAAFGVLMGASVAGLVVWFLRTDWAERFRS